MTDENAYILAPAGLDALISRLREWGYETIGPVLRDGAICYDEITGIGDLPAGWTDEQSPGRYRLRRRDDAALFGHTVAAQSWKKYLFPAQETLLSGERDGQTFVLRDCRGPPPRRAFIGVRACDLQAIAIQDRVFTGGDQVDAGYAARRERSFIVAVNCGSPAGTCFCVSMDSGPRARTGYDLALTELLDGDRHEFLLEVGSRAGAEILTEIAPRRRATAADRAAADAVVAGAEAAMGRTLDTRDVKELLYRNREHPRWNEVAERCVSCGNCTMVCPTCFCSSVTDHTSLDGSEASRERQWASCFGPDFSYMAGGASRRSTASRYRHWLTHKLASWQDQFGTSGCVGCGRCITWCPPGIDITEEVAAIRATDGHGGEED